MKHNSAGGANTMEFPVGKFAGSANTMVKTIDSRWREIPWKLHYIRTHKIGWFDVRYITYLQETQERQMTWTYLLKH
jgi:hypothetical protein